jgi:predicted kinase
MARLIVFGGLPGVGKTTLSKAAARALGAVYLRIDVIEQALRESGMLVGAAGYDVANALAASNLRLGNAVVTDSRNPAAASRAAWRDTAAQCGVSIVELEIICSDAAEHRRRLDSRVSDIPGLPNPAWERVVHSDYEPWTTSRIIIDTAGATPEAAMKSILRAIG